MKLDFILWKTQNQEQREEEWEILEYKGLNMAVLTKKVVIFLIYT